MSAYYNEIDPYAAQWLRNLIAAGHIAPGEVDERSILEVRPDDLREFAQCHFFAGIGIWSHALRCAGWPDDRPVWTGSCPCQPFSVAGKGEGHADERHLWPAWFGLIEVARPVRVFGEQVADGDGYAWLDDVGHDLEGIGYALGAVCTAACGFGCPGERQRLYFVANASVEGLEKRGRLHAGSEQGEQPVGAAIHGEDGKLGATIGTGQQGEPRASVGGLSSGDGGSSERGQPGPLNGRWSAADWLLCRDGKWRPVEPGTFPLAHGAPSRMGRLRAYGNGLNAAQAEGFIRAALEVTP